MRWFVEISPLGKGQEPPRRLCVEAPQWQPALQRARSLAGSGGAMSSMSIELLDDGYRATDKAAMLRFVVRRAPDDAPLSEGGEAAAAASGSGKAADGNGKAPAPASAAAPRPREERKRTLLYGSPGAGGAAPTPVRADDKGSLPAFEVVSRREIAPSDENPLTYREVVYAVAAGTSDESAAALLRARVGEVRESLEKLDPGRLIRMAVFDHTFEGRPQRKPLATLTWKDWRPENPEIAYPLREAEGPPAKAAAPEAPKAASVKAPEAPKAQPVKAPEAPKAAPVKAPVAPKAPPAAAQVSPLTGKASPTVAKASPDSGKTSSAVAKASPDSGKASSTAAKASPDSGKASSTAAKASPDSSQASSTAAKASPDSSQASSTAAKASPDSGKASAAPSKANPKPPARPSADDLLSELFEACVDLHFLPDPIDGAAFILDLAVAKMPSAVGLVSFFDIDRREFVIVRQSGGQRALLERQPERAELAQAALRRGAAVVVADAAGDGRVLDARWRKIGIEPRSVVCAPADAGGRTLGLIELADPLDGGRFTEAEGNALTYLGQQLAEFLAERGVSVDPEAVLADAR